MFRLMTANLTAVLRGEMKCNCMDVWVFMSFGESENHPNDDAENNVFR